MGKHAMKTLDFPLVKNFLKQYNVLYKWWWNEYPSSPKATNMDRTVAGEQIKYPGLVIYFAGSN